LESGWDEAVAVERARRDPREFTPLYEHYLAPVYRYCYRRLGNREAAEDATSQIFIKALSSIGSFDGRSFRAWLFTIAHNVVIDTYRKRRLNHSLDAALDLPDSRPTVEETIVSRDQRSQIRDLLETLPDDQRTVVELRLAGLTGEEIAEALGRSRGAIRALHFRAVARLRALLTDTTPARKEVTDAEPARC
jgi:RNA polymerase sigma-70 factor (ECF subfamily)